VSTQRRTSHEACPEAFLFRKPAGSRNARGSKRKEGNIGKKPESPRPSCGGSPYGDKIDPRGEARRAERGNDCGKGEGIELTGGKMFLAV